METDAERTLRAGVAKKLGYEPTDELWDDLYTKRYVHEALSAKTDKSGIDLICDAIKDIKRSARLIEKSENPTSTPQQINQTVSPTQEPAPPMADPLGSDFDRQFLALSMLVADRARHDQGVEQFRTRFLPNGTIPWTDLETWINSHTTKESVTRYITITLLEGSTIDRTATGWEIELPENRYLTRSTFIESLAWATPDDEWVRRTPTTYGTPPDQLRYLADQLSSFYGWTPAQASVFAVTDVTPLIAPITITEPSPDIRNNIANLWKHRIAIDVDSRISPQQLADIYKTFRDKNRGRKHKVLSLRLSELVIFVQHHAGRSWKERRSAWNAAHPAWSYTHESNMRRDFGSARRRLLRPDL